MWRTITSMAVVGALAMGAVRMPADAVRAAAQPVDYFQFPLPSWAPHCLGFGSEWRYCDGTVLRRCSATGAIWLHTGVDITTGIQPVMAAANGVIIGYIVDPTFRGGILIRHETPDGIVITQYWHVWPRAGYTIGTVVTRGEVFADIADMGSRTHFHFAVFNGDYEADAWRGALPPTRCDGFPAFPYKFVNPNDFVMSHWQPIPLPFRSHRQPMPFPFQRPVRTRAQP
ncbi:MAG TPA: M23 family metallopeptidase [Streptosporangiaceae bacterium]|nr:M23 family metallopeptidase [Streptosporangiaceae bacterium]